jgi:hypothetical protein
MNTKLTLKLQKEVIEQAKIYAREHQVSLSLLVENYFKFLAGKKQQSNSELSPMVKELSGIIDLPENFDLKTEYADYLVEKYS